MLTLPYHQSGPSSLKAMNNKKTINLHLISDSTGETLISVARSVLSQFEGVESKDFIWPLIRTKSQIEKVKESIAKNPGIVMYTIVQHDLIEIIKSYCYELQIPCIPVLSRIVTEFSNYLGMNISNIVGRQHILDEEYFSRVEAINYTINHDDGQATRDLYDADIVIVGVSRTSKSPTSVYLSCRGYKTANIPFVDIKRIPDNIYDLKKPLIVGLIIHPEKLIQIRQTRLLSISGEMQNDYIDLESVKKEIAESRKLYAKLCCPVIDVTKRSVEETAAKIIQLLQDKKNNSKST
jgi:regulator of PEP synthase PpsR (kinase-PPPase family)